MPTPLEPSAPPTIPQIVEELLKSIEIAGFLLSEHPQLSSVATAEERYDILARLGREIMNDMPKIAQYLTEQEERIKKLSKSAKEWHDEGYALGVSDGYNSTEQITEQETKITALSQTIDSQKQTHDALLKKLAEQERRLGIAREALRKCTFIGKGLGIPENEAVKAAEEALHQLSSPQV